MTEKEPDIGLPLALIILALIVVELVSLYSSVSFFQWGSIVCLLALPVLGWRFVKARELYLLGVSGLLTAILFQLEENASAVLYSGLSTGAFLAAFVLVMALLRSGATTSPSVANVGYFLTQQPPNRRFMAVFAGSHYFAVLANLGSLSLLAPIIKKGVEQDKLHHQTDDEVAAIREQRQLTAVMRGFSWFLVWAPTAITQAVMPTLMADINALKLIGLGLVLAVLMLVVSALEDQVRWRGLRAKLLSEGRLPVTEDVRFPANSFLSLIVVSLFLFGIPLVVLQYFDVLLVHALMVAALIVVGVWVFLQARGGVFKVSLAQRFGEIGLQEVPGYIREAIFLGCAGFIGTLAAKLIPIETIALWINLHDQPHWLILIALTVLVWLFGQVGLSPITMAVFLGSLIAEINNFPTDMTLAALAVAAGTAVCTFGAPFSSGALMLSRASGHDPMTLTWRWNGSYIFICFLVLTAYYALLTLLV